MTTNIRGTGSQICEEVILRFLKQKSGIDSRAAWQDLIIYWISFTGSRETNSVPKFWIADHIVRYRAERLGLGEQINKRFFLYTDRDVKAIRKYDGRRV